MLVAGPNSRDELLETAIGELREFWVGVRCTDQCNRTSYIPLQLLAAKRDHRERLRDVVAKLRCQYCKTPPGATWLVDYPIESGGHGGRAATWHVDLTSA